MSTNNISITVKTPPLLLNPNKVDLVKSDFDSLIWNKGYNVYHDEMILCPCKNKEGLLSVNCINCAGSGFVLVKRNETKMVLQGMNYETKFKMWSEEKTGLVRITSMDSSTLHYMDRIVLKDSITTWNQLIYPTKQNKDLYAPLIYPPIEIFYIYLFNGEKNRLLELKPEDYEIVENFIFFKKEYNEKELSVSIRYSHRPQFHIIDLQRDIIYSDTIENKIETQDVKFPTLAIGRRSHFVIDKYASNLTADNISTNENYAKE